MTRILAGGAELDVAEDFDNVLQRISHAEQNGPTVGGVRVLPQGWMFARPVDSQHDVLIQTSSIAYVSRD